MTAHRDLQELENRNFLKRIHGGVVAINNKVTPSEKVSEQSANQFSCSLCKRHASENLLYSITLKNGEQRHTCCPHCGISAHLMLGDDIAMALTADYLFGHPHSVQNTFFVLGSVAVPCCSPSMLTFQNEDMARRFQQGFGGILGRLPDAIAYLQNEMSLQHDSTTCPHCLEAK